MKRLWLIWLCVAAALYVFAAPPELGNPRIIVLANNLQNYYYNPNSGRGDYTQAEIVAKTRKIVNTMLNSDADIFAFCEVEAKPIVLQQLADSMNAHCGVAGRYVALNDKINVDWDEEYNNNIKSGFIYRSDKVTPYGSNYPATTITYYKNTMRIQAWTENSTGEHFTLSMNHFKAMSDDASIAKRVENANWLMSSLATKAKVMDPDILIMGDLNCQMDEEAITVITNKGYEEQLLRFNSFAYSYIYKGKKELIDHAFANASMAGQITGAAVWHTNTSATTANRYSDHDAVMVGLRLGDQTTGLEDNVEITQPYKKRLHNGQLIIERNGVQYLITGQRIQ